MTEISERLRAIYDRELWDNDNRPSYAMNFALEAVRPELEAPLRARIAELEAENAGLREALKPFADKADEYDNYLEEIEAGRMTDYSEAWVRLNDCRRARAVSEKNNSKDMTKLEE